MLDGHIILNVFMGIFIYKFVFMIVDITLRCVIKALEKIIEEDELKMRKIILETAENEVDKLKDAFSNQGGNQC